METKSETYSGRPPDILTGQDVPSKFLPFKLGRMLKAHGAGVAVRKGENASTIAGRPNAVDVRLISNIYGMGTRCETPFELAERCGRAFV